MLHSALRVIASCLALCAAAASVQALTLTTTTPNSQTGGVFMNLTATNTDLQVNSFQVYFNATAGTAITVNVYTRTGTYVGFTGAATGWTIHATVNCTSAGTGTLAPITLPSPLLLTAGQTRAVYLQATTVGLRWNGSGTVAPVATTWTNSDLTLYSEHVRAVTTPAFGTVNTPRTFAGVVNYIRDPAATGACCRQDGSCTTGAAVDCETSPVGVWRGAATTCAGVVCEQPGACCSPQNAACTMLAQFACLAPSTFTGAGTTCEPANPCPAGACCKHDGTCTSVTQSWCQTSGGTYTSDGTACGAAGCVQPGACCLPNGGCLPLLASDCAGVAGTFAGVGVVCALGNCWTAPILYHNGGVVTHPGSGAGGADASQLPPTASTIGASFNSATRVASEIIIPPGQVWTVNKFHTLGYQTNAPTTPLPYTAMFVRILDRDPRLGGAVVVWGDLTTNVLDTSNSAFANTYRMANGTAVTDTARALFKLIANLPGVNLGPGRYWVEWTASNGATAFIPAVTAPGGLLLGTTLQAGAANNYVRLFDGYQPASWVNNGGFPYALPFVLEGSVGVGGACCQTSGACTMVVGDPAVCATGTLDASGTCNPNPCPQPQTGVCCTTDGACTAATPGIPNATCASGTLVVGGTCTPNTCPQPPSGVCCRGSTCSTQVSQAACVESGSAGAAFSAAAACNDGSHTTPCCLADFDKTGGLSTNDIFAFLNAWFAPSPFARFGGDGVSGVLSVDDIFAFINAWFAAGC